ncbi:uncharacterized protein [Aegilops tauschii subsp. strangulata]|uniref:uncharacterized protein isoform X2 n=1 Tax=Aegilops tauschii subsp. strangulata TaxID=200361 RepID=UPI003CC8DE45
MASSAFSIRRYAESMRVEAAAEGRRPSYIEDLPPIKAPRFSWWADELASAVAAAGAAKPLKKRSISDLFDPAPALDVPPGGDSGCNEQTEVDGDEALCTIVRQAKEEKWKRRRQGEEDEEAAATAAPENTGGREPEGNFAATKDTLESPNFPDGLDTHLSQKHETTQHHRKETENISEQINNAKKADTQKCIDNNKKCILTYTRRTSVKMAKEKHGKSKDKEVVELCRKSVNHVNFSEADGVLGSKMHSCELPEQQSLCKLLSDAMASSSSPSSSMSMGEEKCATVESSNSHMPKEAFTKSNEANRRYDHDDSAELSKMSAPLIDLNMAPPECTYLDCTYDSNLEKLENQPPAVDMERVRSSRSADTYLHGEAKKACDADVVGPPLSLRELGETSPSTRQTVRLMGKDVEVCMTRGESFAETAQKHKVNSTSSIQASTYHASTSQAHFEYMTPHDSSSLFATAHVSSGARLPYENRYGDFSNLQTNQPFLLGCPPPPSYGAAFYQLNPPPPRGYFSDPIPGEEPPAAPFLPITGQHGAPSSVCHANSPRQQIVDSASSSVCVLNSVSYTLSHPGHAIQEVSNHSSSGRGVQERSGLVKLTPGAKHILVPSDSTHGNSVPVHSCLPFGSRSGNAAGSENKGAWSALL